MGARHFTGVSCGRLDPVAEWAQQGELLTCELPVCLLPAELPLEHPRRAIIQGAHQGVREREVCQLEGLKFN
jgi:hypothetical protein